MLKSVLLSYNHSSPNIRKPVRKQTNKQTFKILNLYALQFWVPFGISVFSTYKFWQTAVRIIDTFYEESHSSQ